MKGRRPHKKRKQSGSRAPRRQKKSSVSIKKIPGTKEGTGEGNILRYGKAASGSRSARGYRVRLASASAAVIHSAAAIAASAAEDEKQDDPQAAVIAASAAVAHSAAAVAASAAEDQQQDDPQTGIVSAASEKTAATGIFTSASTVCCA